MMEGCDSNLGDNKRYSMLVQDYLKCSVFYLGQFPYAPLLEQQLTRNDLDTVCAYELYQMKKGFVNEDVLDYKNFMKKD